MPTNYQRSEIDAILAQGRRDITTLSGPAVDAFVSAFRHNLDILITRYNELDEQAKAGSKTADQLRRDLLPIRKQAEADFLYWQNIAAGTLDDAVRASWAAGVGMAGSILDIKGAATFKLGTFDRMAYQAQYIATQSGPVKRLLDSIAVDSADKAVDVMRNGIMEGINPRKTAKRLAQAVSADVTRCEVIARTESARAHKEGTLARYMEADVEYVKWMSAEQMRTCPACWAMDGRVYSIDKVPNDHPNGRCVTEPMLDEEVEQARAQYGDDWGQALWKENVDKNTGIMGKMTDEQLMHVFGSHKQIEAFRAGAPLQDAVKMVSNRTWGTSPSVQALKHPGTSPSAPTTPKPPVAPPPPKPVVDWKHNLPDEWTPCDVKTAQQRISDMLSINDDVWGTKDTPSAFVNSWMHDKSVFVKGGVHRCYINPELDTQAIQNVGEASLRYCKFLDEIGIKRPAYLNFGQIRATANGSCGSGIDVNKGIFKSNTVSVVKLVKDEKADTLFYAAGESYSGEIVNGKAVYTSRQSASSFIPKSIYTVTGSIIDLNETTPFYLKTFDHEFGHYLSFYKDGVVRADKAKQTAISMFGGKMKSVPTDYARSKTVERASENWAAFVNYGRDYVPKKIGQMFDDLGWTQAAQNAGVIKWK